MQVWEGTLLLPPKFWIFWLEIKMKQTILDWSDQNIWDHLWRWSTLTGPVILVIQTGMSLFIWQKSIVVPSTAHLYIVQAWLLHTQHSNVWWLMDRDCATGIYPSTGHVEFPKFQTGLFWNGKCPEFLLVRLSDMLVKHLSPYQRYIIRPVI